MFIIFGKRTARIKKYTDNHQECHNCNSFDLDVEVYRDYYHVFYIPVFPLGDNDVKIWCNNCGKPKWLPTAQKHYADITKAPLYFYAFPILLAALITVFIFININNQKRKVEFINNPIVGDIYQMRNLEAQKPTYFFMRLVRIEKDTIIFYHSHLEYEGFVSKLNEDDYFDKGEEIRFLKEGLNKMLENDVIFSIERNYDEHEGFNRIK